MTDFNGGLKISYFTNIRPVGAEMIYADIQAEGHTTKLINVVNFKERHPRCVC